MKSVSPVVRKVSWRACEFGTTGQELFAGRESGDAGQSQCKFTNQTLPYTHVNKRGNLEGGLRHNGGSVAHCSAARFGSPLCCFEIRPGDSKTEKRDAPVISTLHTTPSKRNEAHLHHDTYKSTRQQSVKMARRPARCYRYCKNKVSNGPTSAAPAGG